MQYITQQERKQKTVKIFFTVLGVALFFGLAGGAIIYLARQDSSIQNLEPSISEVRNDEYVLGNPSAPVTLIEYGDFQCPACRAFAPLIEQLHQDFPDQLQIVFRHFPLAQHRNGYPSSYAAEAAGQQGKFWEMANQLYSDQNNWASLTDPWPMYESYAKGLGLNVEQFLRDYNDTTLRNKVKAHQQSGESIGVNSTPTFYLNGQKVVNPPSYEKFKELVSQAIEQ